MGCSISQGFFWGGRRDICPPRPWFAPLQSPKGLRITLPVRSPNRRKLALISTRTSQALLRLLIQDIRTMKKKIEKKIDTYSESLHASTNEAQMSRIMDWCSNRENSANLTTKEKQKRKFERLQSTNLPQQLDPQKVVKNISSRMISSDEQEVLALALNSVKTPTEIPHRAIIAATELTCRQLKSDEAKQLRSEVSKALSEAKPRSRTSRKD